MAQLESEQLLSQLEALKTNPPAAILENGLLRTELRLAARDVSLLLEKPADAIARVMLSQPVESIAVRIAPDLDLFHILSAGRKTLEELTQATKANNVLLARLLRALAAFGAIQESEQYYILSLSYELFADSNFTKGNPTDPKNTAVQVAFNSKNKDLFVILMEKPETAQDFATLMSTWGEGNSLVQDLFPIGQFLAEGESPGSATWVDVGGGYGQKTVALKAAFPQLQGRFIVQDVPYVINGAVKKEGIEYLVHDFFTEQPIKGTLHHPKQSSSPTDLGAPAYYLRQVLHDFPDDQCITILTELHKAMQPDYAEPWSIGMGSLALLGASERTQDQFVNVLRSSGLQVRGCYLAPDGVSEGLLEVEVLE
ncbi:sterigmatocystin 8-O-methyltransferase protein [Rutstroemia sp. NJR-2017a WRK4]|nr:sterigmatocystin 8-O-methyltransferase protein [Rutstroemia sp. NJR-2017a WRK4]